MAKEDALLKKIKEGDMDCLDELVRLYYPDILRYCLWHTAHRQAAEDATQDTFLKALHHLDSYIHRGKFRAYLFKIAANVCVDQWRKKGSETLPDTLPYTERGFEQTEAELGFSKLVAGLPQPQREVVILRFVHDLKVREIAEILGQPMRTVQTRLRTSLKRLEKELAKGDAPHA